MVLLILPNQLFPNNIYLDKNEKIYLLEEPRYFTDFKYHKLKLIYHRASMKKYYNDLKKEDYNISYINFDKINNTFYKNLKNVRYMNPIDHDLNDKYKKLMKKAIVLDNLNFTLKPNEIEENKHLFYKNNKYSHDLFYKFQRERLDILMKNNKPVGNKWSFDTENRKALPKNIDLPSLPKIKKDKYYLEAKDYINTHFKNNYGDDTELIYPIDTKTAIKWLDNFLKKKLNNFGPYQDAVDTEEPFVFHSIISPMMNIGILPDSLVIKRANDYYEKNKASIPIASYEGFIRQVIGWRNYVYSIYLLEPKMYNQNFLNHKAKLNENYWTASTNIKPIDQIIKNIIKYSYCHHIERLMYLGNWFLINQVHPKEVHRIFMEWTIDAYDWVMVPNVMGMSQYADGGKMMTRLYFSSSNYIDKMSTFKRTKNETWWAIWDAIYYSFINKHQKLLESNYATSRQVIHWKNKTNKQKEELLDIANKYKI
jgi:deoxyribodipyrimidine photolyase-related protein